MKNNVPLWFAVKLLVLFGGMYAANHILTGLLVPGGYYSLWMDNNLDYVSALRHLMLKGGALIVSAFGYETKLSDYTLRIQGYGGVRMVYSCIGINILCFWVAFVAAFPARLKDKWIYGIGGLAAITILNMLRVAILVLIKTIPSLQHKQIDHHLIFNITVYAFIFLMMVRMINNVSKKAGINTPDTQQIKQ
ncbi:hypothetical protein CAP35_04885 [Chitinophagaceae bacterium IBVUCB1]|nr:hypothetical protein CAP35_04885 [Chitinophagaceae bacterium IBVUCB1]